MTTIKKFCAEALYFLAALFETFAERADPRDIPTADTELLRAEFENYEDGSFESNATIRTEASKALTFLMVAMLWDAPNYMTTGFSLVTSDGEESYELTVRRMQGESPAQRIASLKSRLDEMKDAAYFNGRQANREGKSKSANEYDDSVRAREWDRGWEDEQMGIPHNA